MKKYISMIAAGLMMVSCVDTIILPDDKTVDEDFWKSKSDVALMVNGAYKDMLSDAVITRLIVWNGLRSDELLPTGRETGRLMEDLRDINLANTQPTNQFVTWGNFYTVINDCNIVLERAGAVMEEDPSYAQGDYLADRSQMLALRALCYFYLVRNFRDVPYITQAYMTSSQDRNVPQAAPDVVLAGCIEDLQEAEKNAIAANAYNDWRRVGYFTRDAIQALLADIYLWRGSVTHSMADYEQCVYYCDKVIESKKNQHVRGRDEVVEQEYPLAQGRNAFYQMFILQNAEESIFELQFNGNPNSSNALCQYYYRINSRSNRPYLYAADIFKYGNTVYNEKVVADWRGLMDTFSDEQQTQDGIEATSVRKFVSNNIGYSPQTTSASPEPQSYSRANDYYMQNYMVYRLTDVMLMKAEALMAMAVGDEDVEHLRPAFNLVQAVNTRSLENESDSLLWNTYSGDGACGKMETLILNERLRELAFEGKRWYDLLRYNYRHVEGVDYTTTLADQNERGVALIENYMEMRTLATRKLKTHANAVISKVNTEARLYLPVGEEDLKVCPVLKQMPTYSSDADYSKDY